MPKQEASDAELGDGKSRPPRVATLFNIRNFLASTFVGGNHHHNVSLDHPCPITSREYSTGNGSNALLTELRTRLGYAGELNQTKRLILRAAQELRMPTVVAECSFSIGMQHSVSEPRATPMLWNLYSQVCLPVDIEEHVRAFIGDIWWSSQVSPELPEARGEIHAFSLPVTDDMLKILAKMFPFPCTRLNFSICSPTFAEWSSDLRFIWIRSSSLWDFVFLVRSLRARKQAEEVSSTAPLNVLHFHGLGDVLI